ncbi:MAG: cell filamentation protein Fic [Actinobacteria bacterium HGW-Actinobacteria-7]|nr:MAG: cell filamentation protein Fic [Actinobacteria bacterium HGW-Actinobacteria-7]
MTVPVHFDEPEGATPLEPDDLAGLIPTWVATREDLNAAEQANIAKALLWAESKGGPHSLDALLSEGTMRSLHTRMFGEVWKWAGHYRRHNTNIGTDWPHISAQLQDLLADVLVQTSDREKLPWPPDELAVRFHHRLVVIHPFPNGNGRHARLAADLLVAELGEPSFTWGAKDLGASGAVRRAYLDALRHADREQNFVPLVEFARG